MKVFILTRGDLIEGWECLFSPNNPCSDAGLIGQKSAEVIVDVCRSRKKNRKPLQAFKDRMNKNGRKDDSLTIGDKSRTT